MVKYRNMTRSVITLLLVLLCAGLIISPMRAISSAPLASEEKRVAERHPATKNTNESGAQFRSLPLRFELNVGQTDRQARFIASTASGDTFLTSHEMVLRVREASSRPVTKPGMGPTALEQAPAMISSAVVRLRTVGANPKARITGLYPLPGKTNYFIGNNPKKWRTNVPSYAKVKYENIYPGIDLIYYGNEGNLEYDFDIAPGADPSRIALSVEGADAVHIDEVGNLVLHTAVGDVSQHAPRIYQDIGGTRREIPGSYKLPEDDAKLRDPKSAIRNPVVAFALGDYDKTKPLVIDPQLVYATYFGGSSETDIKAIAVDAAGSVYAAGDTFAHDFPTRNPLQSTNNHSQALTAVISKLSPDGQSLVYSTYLGGSDTFANDVAVDIALDSTGAAYLVGVTGSADFPTKNPIQAARNGSSQDLFVTKVSPDGSSLVYSTYLGGTGDDEANGIRLDSSNAAYVFGKTASTDFPTVNPTHATFAGGSSDGFLSIINGNGTKLLFSTFIGGPGEDGVSSCVINPDNGDVYLTGYMQPVSQMPSGSNAFPQATGDSQEYIEQLRRDAPDDWKLGITRVIQDTIDAKKFPPIFEDDDGFIFGNFLFSFFGADSGRGTVGYNPNSKISLPQGIQPQGADPGIRITSFDVGLNVKKTVHFGGSGEDFVNGIVRDSQGAVYVVGSTSSTDFPTVNPIQGAYGGNADALVAVFAPDTLNEVFATYLGGSGNDVANGIALDSQGNIYVAGQTTSGDFPTKNAFQSTPPAPNGVAQGQGNSFIAKISAIKPIEETGFTVDDSAGNRNGIIDPNECDGLNISLTNASTSTVTGISTTLSTSTPGVIITQANSAYADISSGGTLTNSTPFLLSTSPSFACGTNINLSLAVTTNQGSFTFPIQLTTGVLGVENFVSSTASVPIPDNNPAGADSAITVSGIPGQVAKVVVSLYLIHTRDSDLTISLIGPDNTTVVLSDRHGGGGANYGTDCPADGNDTLFNDDRTTRPQRIGDGTPPFVRSLGFVPDQPLSAFEGKLANGTWKLHVVDNATGETGTIQCWSMILTPFSCAAGSGPCVSTTPTPTPTPTPTTTTIQFSASSYTVGEGDGRVTLTVTRSGNTSGGASVGYATSDSAGSQACNVFNGLASSRCDYETTIGTLQFAAGETAKTFSVPIIDDSYAEGNETFAVNLTNPAGASLGTQSTATVMIVDNDSVTGPNPIDQPGFFVRQHYLDFLNREPDPSGLNFWIGNITSCGSDQTCIELKRINVSAAFFVSIEFQQTGYLVERIYKASYGDATGTSTLNGAHTLPVPIIRLTEFLPDTQEIGLGVIVNQGNWQQQLENNKQAFTLEFVQRSRFVTAFPTSLTPAQFVDKLFLNAGVTPSASDRTAAINEFGSATTTSDVAARSRALRDVAENSILNQQEFNRAFVLMQFLGYLRRNPNDPQDSDYTGYDFWLTKLNQFNGNYINAEMVKAFISSGEYRNRFGP